MIRYTRRESEEKTIVDCNSEREELRHARFWGKVRKGPGCWLWTASKRAKGYGAFVWVDNGRVVQGRAHRFAWELAHGSIPPGMCVLHRCDVPACVRVEHLFIGDRAANNADMRVKGRTARGPRIGVHYRYRRGEAHPGAKLTSAQVRALRRERRAGMSYAQLARKYGVGIATAYRVAQGQRYSDVRRED